MKTMRIYAGAAAVLSIAACLAGCSIFPEPRQSSIEYFDLKPPEPLRLSIPIDVEPFVTFSGERQKMVRRKGEIHIQSSDFNKWMLPPGALLTRYLRLTFRSPMQDPAANREKCAVLRGEVLSFEKTGDHAALGVRYQLKFHRQTYSKTVLITEKTDGRRPDAFVEAMSRAADRFARMVAAEAVKLEKRK